MFEEIVREVFADHDLLPADIPQLDLYMDQVLTLFDEHLRDNKRSPDDKLMTKTMINNYSKERLLLPVKGKKYTRQHIMQLLCIYQLKQNLLLSDVKALTARGDEIDFEHCYNKFLEIKDGLRQFIPEELVKAAGECDLNDPQTVLSLCLSLTAMSTYMRRLCETIIDKLPEAASRRTAEK